MTAAPRQVLIVEDEFLVAMLIGDMLADLDCTVAATAASLDDALETARSGAFDFALLDLRLKGTATYPVADVLRERGISFAFVTGFSAVAIDPAYADVPILQKPFRRTDLAAILARLSRSG
ncbi:MAG TPA: response regulator [Stellaceae bacterium]|nr:response regulator [Stellaceae bacterium]